VAARAALRRELKRSAPALLLLVAAGALDVLTVRHDTLTEDEPVHYRYGVNVLEGDSTRFDDSKMPATALNALPARVGARLRPGAFHDWLVRVETGRYATIAFALFIGTQVFRWSRELYGPAAGFWSLFLYALDPNLIAHSRLITTDVYAAGMILLALHAFWAFLDRGGWPRAIGSAALLGLAQLAKYTSMYLYPIFFLIVAVREAPALWRRARAGDWGSLGRSALVFAKFAALFAAVSLLVLNLGFLFNRTGARLSEYQFRSGLFQRLQAALPAGHLRVPVPYPFLDGLDWVWMGDREGVGYTYLLGELRGGHGFKGYFLYATLFKAPLPLLIAIAAALAVCVARRKTLRWRDNEVFLLLPVLFFTVYFNFVSHAQWGIRIFLVVFPLLHVLCGVLLRDWPRIGMRARAGLAALAVWLVASVLSYYPHYIPYFNEFVWDRKQAYRYLSDSNVDWGQGEWYLARWREQHPEARVEPHASHPGRIVVGISKLTGVLNPRRYKWLRQNFHPTEHIAHAYLVFDVTPERLRAVEPSASW
jgi:4-amino-4-deoxy-L-arabinose transferase-like glycosyltransferase